MRRAGRRISVRRSENVLIDGRRLGLRMFGTFTGLGREAISDQLTNHLSPTGERCFPADRQKRQRLGCRALA